MGGFLLLGLRFGMDSPGRDFPDTGPYQQADSKQYEGDAQQLPHIEEHIPLEIHLGVFHEFYEEAAAEADDEKDADERTPAHLVQAPFVKRIQAQAQQQIGPGLVQLSGMAGQGFTVAFEDEAPGKGGGAAVNFGIEEVSQTDETGCEGHRYHQVVHYPEHIEVIGTAVLMGIPPYTYYEGYGAAVAGETAFPGLENLQEAFPAAKIVVRLIEEAVTQPRSHYGADKEHIKHRVQQFLVYLFAAEEAPHYKPAQDEAAHKQQRIPSEFESAQLQYGGIHIPVHNQCFHNGCKYTKPAELNQTLCRDMRWRCRPYTTRMASVN